MTYWITNDLVNTRYNDRAINYTMEKKHRITINKNSFEQGFLKPLPRFPLHINDNFNDATGYML